MRLVKKYRDKAGRRRVATYLNNSVNQLGFQNRNWHIGVHSKYHGTQAGSKDLKSSQVYPMQFCLMAAWMH